MVTGMRQVWGEEATRSWLEGIMANEPVFYEKNTLHCSSGSCR